MMQLMVGFIVTLSWSLIIPVVVKLQGLLWALSVIAFYKIVKHMGNFLLPLLNNIELKDAYRYIIIMDALYLICIPLYFVDTETFLIAEAINMVAYTVISNKFHVIYNRFVALRYIESVYNHIQNAERMIHSVASIIGYLIVISVEYISSNIEVAIYTFIVILLVNLTFQYYNYLTYWNEENLKVLQ